MQTESANWNIPSLPGMDLTLSEILSWKLIKPLMKNYCLNQSLH